MDGTLPQVEAPDDVSVRERRCGRCQLDFPAAPDLHATAQPGFWLCPPCRDALLGHQGAGRW
jgi:hypothetical protein